MKLISIIVPVYNVVNYLNRCVDSLVNQTYKNIEIILVNDGSTDKSGELCDKLEEKYSMIQVIHQDNRGVSAARNAGLNAAKGDYVLFVDSDDYIDIEACEMFSAYFLDNVDFISGNYYKIDNDKENKITFYKPSNNKTDNISFLKKQLINKTYSSIVWRNLYDRKFLINNNLFFVNGLIHEDVEWLPRMLLKSKNIIDSDITFYNYIKHAESISNRENQLINSKHLIEVCFKLIDLSNNIEDIYIKQLFNDHIIRKYFDAIYRGQLLLKKNRIHLRDEILELPKKDKIIMLKTFIYKTNKTFFRCSQNFYRTK